jgi:hypothetical protein
MEGRRQGDLVQQYAREAAPKVSASLVSGVVSVKTGVAKQREWYEVRRSVRGQGRLDPSCMVAGFQSGCHGKRGIEGRPLATVGETGSPEQHRHRFSK